MVLIRKKKLVEVDSIVQTVEPLSAGLNGAIVGSRVVSIFVCYQNNKSHIQITLPPLSHHHFVECEEDMCSNWEY